MTSVAVSRETSTDKTASTPIYAYDPPLQLASNLWQVKGSLAVPFISRNMTVYRIPDGRLVLYSVVAMHEEGMRALEALGEPAFMIMPHDRHQMDAPFYKQRYPSLRVLAPSPAARRNVHVDAGLHELLPLRIHGHAIPGTRYHEAVLELPLESHDGAERQVALCACELLTNLPSPGGLLGLGLKLLGPPGGGFGIARAIRFREIANRDAVREWIRALAARTDIRMILVAHGAPITEGAREALQHAAAGA